MYIYVYRSLDRSVARSCASAKSPTRASSFNRVCEKLEDSAALPLLAPRTTRSCPSREMIASPKIHCLYLPPTDSHNVCNIADTRRCLIFPPWQQLPGL